MNLDYIEITKFIGKDKLNFSYLEKIASYQGAEKFVIDRCRKIEVWFYEQSNQVTIKGSLPYWINGHNFHSTIADWKEGLDYLQGCLNLNLFSGIVSCFEYGTIQEIPFPEDVFLRNHIRIQGMTPHEYRLGNVITGKEFNSPALKVKLYDVSRNIKTKLQKPLQEELSRVYGWDKGKHYIKIENHYKKPDAILGCMVYMNELLSSQFQDRLQRELISTYQKIMKTGKTLLPSNKGDINAGTLPLLILKELESVYNFRTEDLLKAKLKEIPDDILSLSDRKARMKTIKCNLEKISSAVTSEYDIEELLKGKIKQGASSEDDSPFISQEKGEDILSYQSESCRG